MSENFELAYLNLKDINTVSKNVLCPASTWESENPDSHLIKILMDPDNFYFTCKHILNVELLPFQLAVLQNLWKYKYPMLIASRGFSKSYMLGLYAVLRALLTQGSKVVILGAGFRQSKVVFDYAETIWRNAPVLKDLTKNYPKQEPVREPDRIVMRVGDSMITALPIGDGTKIRGQRACVHPDTLIETSFGLMKIKDAGQHMEDEKFKVYGNNGFVYPHLFIKTRPIDAYKITTTGGYSFICSDIHRVMTNKGWKLAKDLEKSDKLKINNIGYFPEKQCGIFDEDLAWLFGILVSEGAVSSKHAVAVTSTEKSIVDNIYNKLIKFADKNTISIDYRPAQINKRGWKCKAAYNIRLCNLKMRDEFCKLGLSRVKAPEKQIPKIVFRSPKHIVLKFLNGLFEGDGSVFVYGNNLGVAYYSSSEKLIDQLQILLSKFGLFSCKGKRKSRISDRMQYHLRLYGKNAIDLYDLLNLQKDKAIASLFSRELKFIKSRDFLNVKSVVKLEEKISLYDFSIPEGESFVGNCFLQHNTHLICDEFAAGNEEIYENVVSGFAIVSQNPVQQVKLKAKQRAMQKAGKWSEKEQELIEQINMGNQTILSGTAYYSFNHFYKYWKRYKSIIESKGDKKKLKEIMGEEVSDSFSWKDYCVIRVPVELLPYGFMDERQVARSRATLHKSIYGIEYGAVFATDSAGFFKRTLIESCVTNKPVITSTGDAVQFSPLIAGAKNLEYIFAIDPASERDNFSIVILELHPTHRRIVFCWTTNRQIQRQAVKGSPQDTEHSFYAYCCREIRNLMKKFPCKAIIIDPEGGGRSIIEGLSDKDKLYAGEKPIFPIIEDDKEKITDRFEGLHIIHEAKFSNAKWISEANHGMKKDFEDKVLLFPYFDALSLSLAPFESQGNANSLEQVINEIEELKDELASIIHSQTDKSGREHWDTPEVKMPGQKKGRARKDRYSALLIGNMLAKQLCNQHDTAIETNVVGGFANQSKKFDPNAPLYLTAPSWFKPVVGNLIVKGS